MPVNYKKNLSRDEMIEGKNWRIGIHTDDWVTMTFEDHLRAAQAILQDWTKNDKAVAYSINPLAIEIANLHIAMAATKKGNR